MALSFMAIKNLIKYLPFLALIVSLEIRADEFSEKPLFETGFFIGSVSLADYPAADQTRVRTIPLPLIRYHGDLFRSDDQDGTRLRFINNENIDFDLSFGGSFPTDTGKNQARLGMPNLDWTAEIGPRLLYYFLRDKGVMQIRIGLPVRSVFATDFTKWYGVGYVVAPTFQIDKYNFMFDKLAIFLMYTPIYISEGMADYFYQIESQYQTESRTAYDAKTGFLGNEISLAFKYKWGNKNIIIGSQLSDYSQSANTQSFLHRSNINWSFIAALSWVLYESEARGKN